MVGENIDKLKLPCVREEESVLDPHYPFSNQEGTRVGTALEMYHS